MSVMRTYIGRVSAADPIEAMRQCPILGSTYEGRKVKASFAEQTDAPGYYDLYVELEVGSEIAISRTAEDDFQALQLIQAMETTGHRVVGVVGYEIPTELSLNGLGQPKQGYRVFAVRHEGIRADAVDEMYEELRSRESMK